MLDAADYVFNTPEGDDAEELFIYADGSWGEAEYGYGEMPVALTVSGSVLGVPTPTAYPADPDAGRVVEFSESGAVTLNRFATNSPTDTNGLTYSWDALALLQSVARSSDRAGGSGGLPAWLLGILAAVLMLSSGVMREAGPKLLHLSRIRLARRWRTIAGVIR